MTDASGNYDAYINKTVQWRDGRTELTGVITGWHVEGPIVHLAVLTLDGISHHLTLNHVFKIMQGSPTPTQNTPPL